MSTETTEQKYPKWKEWDSIGKQMFDIWVRLGKNDADQCPMIPTLGECENDELGMIIKLNKRWGEFENWLRRNDCMIQPNGKVVRLPAPKKKPLIVDPASPYACDVLERNKKVGDLLSQLVSIQAEPFVLAVDGAWGSGKSVLFEMWKPALENDFDVISFNAWENDATSDPLVALAAEVDSKYEGKIDPEKFHDLFRIGGNLLLKGLSLGLCSTKDLDAEKLKPAGEQKINSWFTLYRSQKELTAAFQRQLNELAKEAKGGKLVFLIDELDRCRPTYAIEFLERIKHLFMVPGVCFALALDREQLGKAIQAVYGQINTEGYLRRFIDLTYKLPAPEHGKFIELLFEEQHLDHYLSARTNEGKDTGLMKRILAYFADNFCFGLRDIEHIIRQLVLVARSTPDNTLYSPWLTTVLACLKFHDEKLYYDFRSGAETSISVLDKLSPMKMDQGQTLLCVHAAFFYADPYLSKDQILQHLQKNSSPAPHVEHIGKLMVALERDHYPMDKKTVLVWIHDKLELTNDLVG